MHVQQPNGIERPRSVAEIIGEALDMYQAHPLLFLTLALGVIAPYELIVLAVTGEGPLASGSQQNPGLALVVSCSTRCSSARSSRRCTSTR